jgi:hypothetical protein
VRSGKSEHMRECKMASLNESRSQSPAKSVKPSLALSHYAFMRLGLTRKSQVRSGSVRFGWACLGKLLAVSASAWRGSLRFGSGLYGRYGAVGCGLLMWGLVRSGLLMPAAVGSCVVGFGSKDRHGCGRSGSGGVRLVRVG